MEEVVGYSVETKRLVNVSSKVFGFPSLDNILIEWFS